MLRRLQLRPICLQSDETKQNINKQSENKKIVYIVQKRGEKRDKRANAQL